MMIGFSANDGRDCYGAGSLYITYSHQAGRRLSVIPLGDVNGTRSMAEIYSEVDQEIRERNRVIMMSGYNVRSGR
jgi:hypothetical protein